MFNIFFIHPIFNTLVFLYNTIAFHDLGVAIIIVTIGIRCILFPLFYKSYHNQALMQKIQPDIKRVQGEHKNDRELQARKIMEIYRENNVNPFSSFLLILIQLPILIALYKVFFIGLTPESLRDVYSFIETPQIINNNFINLIDLSKRSTIIVGLAAFFQYIQGRLSLPKEHIRDKENTSAEVARKMVIVGPILTTVILYTLPSAVGIYWLTSSIFSVVQQVYVNKKVYGEPTRTNKKSGDHTTSTHLPF